MRDYHFFYTMATKSRVIYVGMRNDLRRDPYARMRIEFDPSKIWTFSAKANENMGE